MKKIELDELLDTIMRRGDPVYNTPSGAFLEYLSKLASQLNLAVFAEACACYVSVHREASAFVAARVPGILCNRYFTVLPDFDYDKFIRWSVETPNWGAELNECFTSPERLSFAVASICSAVEGHA